MKIKIDKASELKELRHQLDEIPPLPQTKSVNNGFLEQPVGVFKGRTIRQTPVA